MKRFFIASLCIILCGNISAQKNRNDFNSMIAAEYNFAKSASEIGTRDAFLKFIADDGILFRPKAVNGKEFLNGSPKRPGLLSWYPVYAQISADGDMGFTTGPADFRKDKDSASTWFGNFCTVWERQEEGEWKFAIDFGNSCPEPEMKPEGLRVAPIPPGNKSSFSKKTTLKPDELFSIDTQFEIELEKRGIAESYKMLTGNESRILRDGINPLIGSEQISEYFAGSGNKLKFKPAGGKISSSNDIGFTYGEMESSVYGSEGITHYNYLRIYKKEGNRWLLAIEVANKI